jgi:uncharacterized protein (DUF1810 family)
MVEGSAGRPDARGMSEARAPGSIVSLDRFVEAQAGVIDVAMAELAAGRKRSHWMWFVFPQLALLGRSATAKHFGLASVGEAREYLAHPLLGERLLACTRLALRHARTPVRDLFGTPDDLKFRSCMTLFGIAAPVEPLFREALRAFFDGQPDPLTVDACARDDEGTDAGP